MNKANLIKEWASSLDEDDLVLLSNALNEILNGPDAIDEWEFQTRTGIETGRARQALQKITVLCDKLQEKNSAN
jgi:hypothetical protein